MQNSVIFFFVESACAKQFAELGAKLLLCARRIDVLSDIAQQLKENYDIDIHTFQLDVRDKSKVYESLTMLPDQWKKIDILVNNADLAAGMDFLQEGDIQIKLPLR